MSVGPRKISVIDVWVSSLGSMIAWLIGSSIILLIVLVSSSIINIPGTFAQASLAGGTTNPIFPFILSFITFVALLVTTFITAKFLNLTDPNKYSSNPEIYGQIGIFWILLYLCLTPIYIYTGLQSYDSIMIIFIVHVLLFAFWAWLLLELLNNYRYILIWLYGNFIALCFSSALSFLIFYSFSSSQAKLIALLGIVPLIYTLITAIRWLFEFLYYKYYLMTNLDGLGDIFYRIEEREKELQKEEQEKNSL